MRDLDQFEIQQVNGGAAAFSPLPHDAGAGALVAPWAAPATWTLGGGIVALPVPSTLEDRTAGS